MNVLLGRDKKPNHSFFLLGIRALRMLGREIYVVGAVPCNITAAGFSKSMGKQVADQGFTYGIELHDLSMLSPKETFAAARKDLGRHGVGGEEQCYHGGGSW